MRKRLVLLTCLAVPAAVHAEVVSVIDPRGA